jgi:hypothetical protein
VQSSPGMSERSSSSATMSPLPPATMTFIGEPSLTHRQVHPIAEAGGVEGGWPSGEGAMTVHGEVGFRR